MDLDWEEIESVEHTMLERAKVQQGWLVRQWSGDQVVGITFVPDPNEMWGK